jgi:ABC-type bacteriocin/lantibiotic exporter with double-glycine peptidase domain
MLELRNVFRRIGLKATGRRETIEGLIKGSYPAIAHLDSNHFVTVSMADDKVVRFFDGSGRAKTMKLSDFGKEWDGTLLV